mgnify:CR=1 FL=1
MRQVWQKKNEMSIIKQNKNVTVHSVLSTVAKIHSRLPAVME